MKIGLFYATYSGGTQMAANFLAQKLTELGHQVETKTIAEVGFDNILGYDLFVFASPSWDDNGREGQPHQDFLTFMEKSAGKNFSGKSCAIMGLGDRGYTHFCGAVDILTDFINKAGGKLVTESLRIDGYLFDTTKNNNLIAAWAPLLKS